MGACVVCVAGKYQESPNATACEECPLKSWCAAGSSSPTPCEIGTAGRDLGLSDAQQCEPCNLGHWCSGGQENRCGANTYNELRSQSNVEACKQCPTNSEAPQASSSIDDCQCSRDYYDTLPALGAVDCAVCPAGSVCAGAGATLEAMPLLRG